MWLEKLKELKTETGMSVKQIAEKRGMSEKTVARIFSGDTDRPYMDTLYEIVTALGGSLDDLFAEGKARLASEELINVQNDVVRLTADNAMITAENAVLKDKVSALTAENDLLRMKLEHKEEIISLHNYYRSVLNGKPHD
jgi:transcriptional regulator with XRE-family HTH domain